MFHSHAAQNRNRSTDSTPDTSPRQFRPFQPPASPSGNAEAVKPVQLPIADALLERISIFQPGTTPPPPPEHHSFFLRPIETEAMVQPDVSAITADVSAASVTPVPTGRQMIQRCGLARKGTLEKFTEETNKQLQSNQPIPSNQVASLLGERINKLLNAHKVPAVSISLKPFANPDIYGQFDSKTWTIHLNANHLAAATISADKCKEIAATMYHEARHAEQFFSVARWIAAQYQRLVKEKKPELEEKTPEQIAFLVRQHMSQDIPLEQAQAATAKVKMSKSKQAFAAKMYDSIYQPFDQISQKILGIQLIGPTHNQAFIDAYKNLKETNAVAEALDREIKDFNIGLLVFTDPQLNSFPPSLSKTYNTACKTGNMSQFKQEYYKYLLNRAFVAEANRRNAMLAYKKLPIEADAFGVEENVKQRLGLPPESGKITTITKPTPPPTSVSTASSTVSPPSSSALPSSSMFSASSSMSSAPPQSSRTGFPKARRAFNLPADFNFQNFVTPSSASASSASFLSPDVPLLPPSLSTGDASPGIPLPLPSSSSSSSSSPTTPAAPKRRNRLEGLPQGFNYQDLLDQHNLNTTTTTTNTTNTTNTATTTTATTTTTTTTNTSNLSSIGTGISSSTSSTASSQPGDGDDQRQGNQQPSARHQPQPQLESGDEALELFRWEFESFLASPDPETRYQLLLDLHHDFAKIKLSQAFRQPGAELKAQIETALDELFGLLNCQKRFTEAMAIENVADRRAHLRALVNLVMAKRQQATLMSVPLFDQLHLQVGDALYEVSGLINCQKRFTEAMAIENVAYRREHLIMLLELVVAERKRATLTTRLFFDQLHQQIWKAIWAIDGWEQIDDSGDEDFNDDQDEDDNQNQDDLDSDLEENRNLESLLNNNNNDKQNDYRGSRQNNNNTDDYETDDYDLDDLDDYDLGIGVTNNDDWFSDNFGANESEPELEKPNSPGYSSASSSAFSTASSSSAPPESYNNNFHSTTSTSTTSTSTTSTSTNVAELAQQAGFSPELATILAQLWQQDAKAEDQDYVYQSLASSASKTPATEEAEAEAAAWYDQQLKAEGRSRGLAAEYQQDNAYHIFSKRTGAHANRRVYINVNQEAIPLLFQTIEDLMQDQTEKAYDIKVWFPGFAQSRRDPIVVYTDAQGEKVLLETLRKMRANNATVAQQFVEECMPFMTSVAGLPGVSSSYEQVSGYLSEFDQYKTKCEQVKQAWNHYLTLFKFNGKDDPVARKAAAEAVLAALQNADFNGELSGFIADVARYTQALNQTTTDTEFDQTYNQFTENNMDLFNVHNTVEQFYNQSFILPQDGFSATDVRAALISRTIAEARNRPQPNASAEFQFVNTLKQRMQSAGLPIRGEAEQPIDRERFKTFLIPPRQDRS